MSEVRVTPLVSVILPTFNRSRVLGRAIQSVLAQTFSELELIIVDDGSADDTASLVAAIKDPRIRYIRHSGNLGAAAARNTGIRAAASEWLAFQDSDDEWLPDKLEKQWAAARGAPGMVIYCGFRRRRGESFFYTPHKGIRQREGDVLGELLLGNFVSTQTILIRKELLEEIGGFDDSLPRLQDWDVAIRLAMKYPFRLVDEPLVRVNHSPDSISEQDEAQLEALTIIFEKHVAVFEQYPDSRFRILAGFALANLTYGKFGLAGRQFRAAMAVRPRTARGWGAFFFSYLLPNIYWRIRG